LTEREDNMTPKTLTGNQIPSDHAFARELKKRGWQGGYSQKGNTNTFFDTQGKNIAIAYYDNTANIVTKVVWL